MYRNVADFQLGYIHSQGRNDNQEIRDFKITLFISTQILIDHRKGEAER